MSALIGVDPGSFSIEFCSSNIMYRINPRASWNWRSEVARCIRASRASSNVATTPAESDNTTTTAAATGILYRLTNFLAR